MKVIRFSVCAGNCITAGLPDAVIEEHHKMRNCQGIITLLKLKAWRSDSPALANYCSMSTQLPSDAQAKPYYLDSPISGFTQTLLPYRRTQASRAGCR